MRSDQRSQLRFCLFSVLGLSVSVKYKSVQSSLYIITSCPDYLHIVLLKILIYLKFCFLVFLSLLDGPLEFYLPVVPTYPRP